VIKKFKVKDLNQSSISMVERGGDCSSREELIKTIEQEESGFS
jgi:hypothetical protein